MQPQSEPYITEEDVKIKFLLPYSKQAGYFADVVVYSSAKKEPHFYSVKRKPLTKY